MTQILKILLFVFISTLSLHAGIQKVTTSYIQVQATGDSYVGNASNQTYSLNASLIPSGSNITIIDQGGSNTIELVGGLTITSSKVVSDELILTLSNGASVNIRGADTFTFDIGANQTSGIAGTKKTFASFVTGTLGLASVPTRGQAAVGGGLVSAIVDGGLVANLAPTVNAGADKSAASGTSVALIATASDSDGTIVSYEWKEGVTVLSTLSSFSKSDFSAGTHTITLTATDNGGATATDTVVVIVTAANSAPVANAGIDQTVNKDTNVLLDASGSHDDGSIVSYSWKEGGTVLSTASSFSISSLSVGTHTITLTVTDNDGATASDNMTLIVIKSVPILKTGQIISYAAHDDGYYQSGVDRSYSRVNETVIDNSTELQWQDDNNVNNLTFFGWNAESYCSNLDLSNYQDWRLPTALELLNIADKGKSDSSMPLDYLNIGTGMYTSFWVLSRPSYEGNRRYVEFSHGSSLWNDEAAEFNVRCVRGTSNIENSTKKEGNTVIDYKTNLIWQDDSSTPTANWEDAINYCENLVLNNLTAWRLPNINELLSITNFEKDKSNILESQGEKWSSTTNNKFNGYAWTVNLSTSSSISWGDGKTTLKGVSCVHDFK